MSGSHRCGPDMGLFEGWQKVILLLGFCALVVAADVGAGAVDVGGIVVEDGLVGLFASWRSRPADGRCVPSL